MSSTLYGRENRGRTGRKIGVVKGGERGGMARESGSGREGWRRREIGN